MPTHNATVANSTYINKWNSEAIVQFWVEVKKMKFFRWNNKKIGIDFVFDTEYAHEMPAVHFLTPLPLARIIL